MNKGTLIVERGGERIAEGTHAAFSNGSFQITTNQNVLILNWTGSAPVDLSSGILCELKFISPPTGGGFSNLTWLGSQSVFTGLGGGSIPGNFIGGSVAFTLIMNLGPDRTVCYYHTATMFAGGNFAAYLWSTGDTSNTIEVDSVVGAGICSVTVTDVSGCQGWDEVQVDVDPCYAVEEYR